MWLGSSSISSTINTHTHRHRHNNSIKHPDCLCVLFSMFTSVCRNLNAAPHFRLIPPNVYGMFAWFKLTTLKQSKENGKRQNRKQIYTMRIECYMDLKSRRKQTELAPIYKVHKRMHTNSCTVTWINIATQFISLIDRLPLFPFCFVLCITRSLSVCIFISIKHSLALAFDCEFSFIHAVKIAVCVSEIYLFVFFVTAIYLNPLSSCVRLLARAHTLFVKWFSQAHTHAYTHPFLKPLYGSNIYLYIFLIIFFASCSSGEKKPYIICEFHTFQREREKE